MNYRVLLNALNKLRKSDKTRGLSSILSVFRNELNIFNTTSERMLGSIYHMTLRFLCDLISCEKVKSLSVCTQHSLDVIL